jgi:uncharacterized OB-fold protein
MSEPAGGLTAAAQRGRFELQECGQCGAVQYPPREVCRCCLADELTWKEHSPAGTLISESLVHRSQDPRFDEGGPWRIGLVRLTAGVTLVAFVDSACAPAPSEVRLVLRVDDAGRGVVVASRPGKVVAVTTEDFAR